MIDRATVERIKETANIVDVVGEFVTLRKSGANYKGLCPFHNEKTPSFYVSPARGTCHCFGCGKGGNAITFIMEHEQMTYPEALRWLAKKYHIEIQERELTSEERQQQSERESMFIVNEWANEYFQKILHHDVDGIAIGMQYFRSRGFRDDTITKFQLGYDLPDRLALGRAAMAKGFQEQYLIGDTGTTHGTGICYKNDRGELIDRYAGRVVFPWISSSGRIIGFTARVLDSRTKGVNQKYVNSPDSEIFHKTNELYGIFQAKKAIAKEDRVYMVEGQADVISMFQSGVENVVANSGTALTLPQTHLLHRFTSNITLIYDNDAAGIHAALRGMDMLLAEGMNVKVLLLPAGEDPDSFARKNTAEDFKKYIEMHQTDFIQFKTELLLNGVTDQTQRSEAIGSIVRSISFVQNQILRDIYLHDSAQRLGMNEATLINTMNRYIRDGKEQKATEARREQERFQPEASSQPIQPASLLQQATKVETMLIQLVIRHGEKIIVDDAQDDEGNVYALTVAQFIHYNLTSDHLGFHNELYNQIMQEAVDHSGEEGFVAEQYFIHHPDIEISKLASDMSFDRYQLIHAQQMLKEKETEPTEDEQQQKEKKDRDQLREQARHLLLDFKMDYVTQHLKDLQRDISLSISDPEKMMKLMAEYKDMQQIRNSLAKELGNDILI